MSTRSIIAIEAEDKSITTIYCHFDGYLEGVGRNLLNHFQDISDISYLMSQGNTSSLGKNKEKFTAQNPEGTDYYYYNSEAVTYKNMKEFRKHFRNNYTGIEYFYLFKNNKWVYSIPGLKKFVIFKK